MQSIGFAVPLSDQTGATVEALTSCWLGARRESFRDARRRAGIVREAVWIQSGTGGDLAVVYLEADDLDVAFTILGTSAEPFDSWFRAQLRHVYGVAWDERLARAELLLDFDVTTI